MKKTIMHTLRSLTGLFLGLSMLFISPLDVLAVSMTESQVTETATFLTKTKSSQSETIASVTASEQSGINQAGTKITDASPSQTESSQTAATQIESNPTTASQKDSVSTESKQKETELTETKPSTLEQTTESQGETSKPQESETSTVAVKPQAQKSVSISSSQGSVVQQDEMITLTGKLSGFEGLHVKLQWQYFDGIKWHDAENANEITYVYKANERNLTYEWRLRVTVI